MHFPPLLLEFIGPRDCLVRSARGTEVRCVKSLHLVVCKHVAGAKVYDTKVTVRSVRAVIENSVVVVSTCLCRDDKNSDIRIATNLVQTDINVIC